MDRTCSSEPQQGNTGDKAAPYKKHLMGLAVLGVLALAIGVAMRSVELRDATPAASGSAVQGDARNERLEVDFGFVELDPGQPVAIPSYKSGKAMMLYSGDELEFRAFSDGPIALLELRVGEEVQLLPGATGKVEIVGPLNQPLPAVLLARGSRVSLPGGAPPRISVKVHVFGVARRK